LEVIQPDPDYFVFILKEFLDHGCVISLILFKTFFLSVILQFAIETIFAVSVGIVSWAGAASEIVVISF
jgi:hypothetical protein